MPFAATSPFAHTQLSRARRHDDHRSSGAHRTADDNFGMCPTEIGSLIDRSAVQRALATSGPRCDPQDSAFSRDYLTKRLGKGARFG